MKNAKQIWKETAKQLEKVYASKEASNISYLLLEDLCDIGKTAILSEEQVKFDDEKLTIALGRLLNHEPVQYVTGIADFYGGQFQIEKGALIPRPETEELIDLIKRTIQIKQPKVLDIGTGSGCIAITLALELGGEVYASDVSEEALSIARFNAEKLNANVSFLKHDVLKEKLPFEGLDVLVSNPPYIPEVEQNQMSQNVINYEPGSALFVPDDDPLIFYRKIGEAGKNILKPKGGLFFEIHEAFGQQVKQLIENLGYSQVYIHQDMQGKNRMVSAINSTST